MTSFLAPEFAVRHRIAKDYCRVVAAIDDEIFQEGNKNDRLLSEEFFQLQRSCADNGVLCHLHHYPKYAGDPRSDDVVEDSPVKQHHLRALEVAKSADALILDWYLGSRNDASHAESILRDLAATDPVRFILIYTSEDTKKVEKSLLKIFPDLKPLIERSALQTDAGEEEAEEPGDDAAQLPDESTPKSKETLSQKPAGFHLNNRLFIFIGTKKVLDAADVLTAVREALTHCFPDHLKWAGLEMAVKTRELLPRIIACLPDHTDSALMLQMLYQEDNEVAEQVSGALVDELKASLRDSPLESVCDETLALHLRELMAFRGDSEQEAAFEEVASNLGSDYVELRRRAQTKKQAGEKLEEAEKKALEFQKRWKRAKVKTLRNLVIVNKDVGDFFPHQVQEKVGSRQKELDICQAISCYLSGCSKEDAGMLRPSVSWATVRESVLLAPKNAVMQPGAVLRKVSEGGDDPEWVLCLTGACDCHRNKNGFLVAAGEGRQEDTTASILRQTQTAFQEKEIVWDSSRLIVLHESNIKQEETQIKAPHAKAILVGGELTSPENIEEMATEVISEQAIYRVVGYLRQEFATRLIHRVWTYQTRVGVDSSELLRQRRAE